MARRLWLFGACVLPLAGCAVADLRPGIVRHETPKQIWQKFHGPGVHIRAVVVTSNQSRVIEPVVSLSDSAYIVIGDIGDDGTMRILYPARPGDSNYVKKQWSFEGPRFQPRIVLPFMPTAFATPRTAPGYAFVIASSIPLDLSKLTEERGDRWSVFDVMHDNYMTDPRASITDLVTAISSDVGQVSISYAAYSWGIVGPRAGLADRSTSQTGRRRLPRPPI